MEDNLKTNREEKTIMVPTLSLILFTLMFSIILVNCSEDKKVDMISHFFAPLPLTSNYSNTI